MRLKWQSTKLNLVVIVEHDPAVSGDSKVLEQHITGKNIRSRQLLNGVTVVVHHFVHLVVGGILQIQVEGIHAALDVTVFDDQGATIHTNLGWTGRMELVHEFLGESAGIEYQIVELLCIGHPTRAIPAFHQVVLILHNLVSHLLGRGEAILDNLEDILI